MGSRSDPDPPSLVDDVDGRIATVLMIVADRTAHDFESGYRAVLRAFPGDAELLLIVQPGVRALADSWIRDAGLAHRCQWVTAPGGARLSVWAQDAVLGVCRDGSSRLVRPYDRDDVDGGLACDALEAAGRTLDRCSLPVDGGNLLVGDDFVLVGSADIDRCRRLDAQRGEGAFERAWAAELDSGRRPVRVGSRLPVSIQNESPSRFEEGWVEVSHLGNVVGTTQPVFHLDLFMSLAGRGPDGRYRVLVGDPRLAGRLIGQAVTAPAAAEHFDDIAEQLVELGFDVVRNPLPLVYMDELRARRRVRYFASSNNVWVEDGGAGSPVVWLPTYGDGSWPELVETDEANAAIWDGLGFAVRRVGGLQPLAENRGSLRCLGKIIDRRPQPRPWG